MNQSKQYNLSQFMEEIVPVENSKYAFVDSNTGYKIHDVVKHESLTAPIVASFFWEIITQTNFYDFYFEQYARGQNKNDIRSLVVNHGEKGHGERQYSMLVLIPDLPFDTHYIVPVNDIPNSEIQLAFDKWVNINNRLLSDLRRSFRYYSIDNRKIPEDFDHIFRIFDGVDPDFVYGILQKISMNIVFNRAPKEELTTALLKSDSFHKVINGNGEYSTAGIYGICEIDDNGKRKDIFGVTICRHALLEKAKGSLGKINMLKHNVEVNGIPGRVISEDIVSDSCFVSLDPTQVSRTVPCLGPLRILPDPNKELYFEGASSGGKKKTKINPLAWDNNILTPNALVQRRISTPPVTDPGDSGAALFNDEGNVIGFAFARTGFNESPEYSSWIWADSVFQIHNLKIL
jgi:hypothetical protein